MSEISEAFRKIGLFGIGVVAITQEKIEELAKEMVDKGEINREEGKKLVKDVLSEKDRYVKEIGDMINQRVKDGIEKSGVATKRDIDALRKRLERLERNVAAPEYIVTEE